MEFNVLNVSRWKNSRLDKIYLTKRNTMHKVGIR